jgi:hypothetical protein
VRLSHFALYGLVLVTGALLLAGSGCTITTEGIEKTPLTLEEIFPPSKAVASYRQADKPARADEKLLTEQLGGKNKLEILKKWGAINTLSCDYGLPERPPKVRLTVTEMPSKIFAYGAYTNLRPALLPERQYVKIGVHGTIDNGTLMFVQDRYFMIARDLSNAPEEQRRAMLVNFATNLSDRIPRNIADVEPISFLPIKNRVTASERLDKEDPLGLGIFTEGGATALYRSEDKEAKIFMALGAAGLHKYTELNKIKLAMQKEGPVREYLVGDKGFQGVFFGKPCLIAARENVVFGVYGTYRDDELREMMATIDRKIKPLIIVPYQDIKRKEAEKEKEEEEEKKRRPE